MQSKRDGLIPVAEVLSDLNGPVAAIRDTSPQALHHFTLADQVNQLVRASEADPERGFMARMMALCSLPPRQPTPVQAGQRAVQANHVGQRGSQAPLRQPASPVVGLGVESQIGELRERMAHLEGLLEGLREAITGRARAS